MIFLLQMGKCDACIQGISFRWVGVAFKTGLKGQLFRARQVISVGMCFVMCFVGLLEMMENLW